MGSEVWIYCLLHNSLQVESASPKAVRFKSNLFGSFGAGLFTGPNTIDFGVVFDNFGAKLLENIHILATMFSILGAYVILVVYFRRQDKQDKLKVIAMQWKYIRNCSDSSLWFFCLQWTSLPLLDNHPDDEYTYEVNVFTGFIKNAQSRSKVSFILIGTEGTTGVRNLDDGVREVRSRIQSIKILSGTQSFGAGWFHHIFYIGITQVSLLKFFSVTYLCQISCPLNCFSLSVLHELKWSDTFLWVGRLILKFRPEILLLLEDHQKIITS